MVEGTGQGTLQKDHSILIRIYHKIASSLLVKYSEKLKYSKRAPQYIMKSLYSPYYAQKMS